MSVTFPSTRWSIILAHRDRKNAPLESSEGGESSLRELAQELCRDYWRPVYSYIRVDGYGREDAEDLTQGFFAAALESDLFEKADPAVGKLRSYLLGALKHYLSRERRRVGAQKRGGHFLMVSLDTIGEENSRGFAIVPASPEMPPDRAFDRRWAECLLVSALDQLRGEFAESGKLPVYEALRPFLDGGGDLDELAGRLGVSEGAARVALHRARKRYRELIRSVIQASLSPGQDVSVELSYLIAVLRGEKMT